MKTSRTILLWAPRLLLLAFALFLVVFSFDVFGEGKSTAEIAIGFVLHNIPTLLLCALVFVSWRREWLGMLVCALLALAYIGWSWNQFPLTVYFLIAGPLLVIAVLYGLNWRIRKRAT